MKERIDEISGAVIITPSEEMLGIERLDAKLDRIESKLDMLIEIIQNKPCSK